MKTKIAILMMLVIGSAFGNGYFIKEENKTNEIDLNTFDYLSEKSFEIKNTERYLNISFGLSREEYMEPNGIFAVKYTTSGKISQDYYLNRFVNVEWSCQGSITSIIAKQALRIGLFANDNFRPYVMAQFGEKLNIINQENNGIPFFNNGIGLIIETDLFMSNTYVYVPYSDFIDFGIYADILFNLKSKSSFGFYIKKDHYKTFSDSLNRSGQSNLSGGFTFRY